MEHPHDPAGQASHTLVQYASLISSAAEAALTLRTARAAAQPSGATLSGGPPAGSPPSRPGPVAAPPAPTPRPGPVDAPSALTGTQSRPPGALRPAGGDRTPAQLLQDGFPTPLSGGLLTAERPLRPRPAGPGPRTGSQVGDTATLARLGQRHR